MSEQIHPRRGEGLALWPAGGDRDDAVLEVYLADAGEARRAGVIVCPGGGYWGHAIGHEGRDVAQWLNGLGIHGFVLRYRTAPGHRHPAPLDDARRAVQLVRHRAGDWGLDPSRVGMMGFSAGGHVTACAATMPVIADPAADDPVERRSSRPDAAILCYAVISFVDETAHLAVRDNLLGPDPSGELCSQTSAELAVTSDTPPTFIVTGHDDAMISPAQSAIYYTALARAGVPAEFHAYSTGPHGIGLGLDQPVIGDWSRHLARWLGERGFHAAAASVAATTTARSAT